MTCAARADDLVTGRLLVPPENPEMAWSSTFGVLIDRLNAPKASSRNDSDLPVLLPGCHVEPGWRDHNSILSRANSGGPTKK